ncbi:sensor histidine kinase [Pendulispora albinea]|uniref:Histidine kinase n=1 Tax=Pendulispora albinea TaxID=2741071 RepID=A0ABZ2MAG3_9BACT
MTRSPLSFRQGVVGVAIGILGVASPLVPRGVFGTLPPGYIVCTLLVFVVTLGLGVVSVLFVFARAQRAGWSLGRAAMAGLISAFPIMMGSFLGTFALHRAFPSLPLVYPDPNEPDTLAFRLITSASDSFPMLAAWAGLVLFPAALRAHDQRQRELEQLRLEAELLRLRSHLEPHFVLNTLNAIAGFVTDDPVQARELLAALGDLFREATEFRDTHRVADEVSWLRRYVAIHELRHPDLLHVTWSIDPAAEGMAMPALLLQPLVENAVKHGALRGAQGRLHVRVAVEGATLVSEVRDDGPGPGPRRTGGQGLHIVERRLAFYSSGKGHFELAREGAETVARVRLAAEPMREPSDPRSARDFTERREAHSLQQAVQQPGPPATPATRATPERATP